MSTATKLEYLNDTKQLLKENINNLGGNLTNEPFRQYASVLEGIYESLPKVSGIGSNLSLSPSMVGKIKLNEIQGNTLQNGSPTPSSPVPIQSVTGLQNVGVCGKNIFDNFNQGSIYPDTGEINPNANSVVSNIIPVKPNTTYCWQCVSSLQTKIDRIATFDINGNFISRSDSLNTTTFTTDSNTYYIRFNMYKNGGITPSDVTKAQLEVGSTATSYEPYKGNTYEVNLGKNLLDIQGIVKGRLDNGVIGYASDVSDLTLNDNSFSFTTTANYRGVTSDYIKINGTKCVFSNKSITFGSQLNVIVACYDNSKTFLSNASLGSTNLTYMVATLPNNTSYIRVYLYLNSAGTITIEEPQLEKGSQATSYSPYFTPIELNKIGTYKDSIKKSSGKNLFDYKYDNVKNVTRSTKSEETNGFKITSTGVSGFGYASLEIDNSLLGKTVTISMTSSGNKTPSGRLFNVNTSGNVTTAVSNFWTTNNSFTITLPSTLESGVKCIALCLYISQTNNSSGDYAIFKNIMIEENSQTTDYEPYGKVWYVTKNEIKYNVDTTQLTLKSNYTNIEYAEIPKPSNYVGYNSYDHTEIKYTNANWIEMSAGGWDLSNNIGKISGNADKLKWWVGFTKGTGLDAIKTALTGSYIVYPLATPIYEVITNTELINQLESLNNAKSEDGTTNINVTSEDLSMLLNVGVIKGDA